MKRRGLWVVLTYVLGMLLMLPFIMYVWIEFIKLCSWLGEFTWP